MSNALHYIADIDFDNIHWLTYLRNKIAENGNFEIADIEYAFENLFNTSLLNEPTNHTQKDKKGVNQPKKALHKIYENKNLAGIFNDRELEFSPLITIIYGKNGTGKTTFYKALKDAFYGKQDIKGNIYVNSNEVPNAKIVFTDLEKYKKFQRKGISYDKANDETISWKAGNCITGSIKFCDDKILAASLTKKETGWDIDRFKLSAFSNFQEAINELEKRIKAKIQDLEAEFLNQFMFLISPLSANNELRSNSFDKKNLSKWKSLLSTTIPDNIEDLKKNYEREKSLNASDYADKLKNLENENTEIDTLKTHLQKQLVFLKETERLNNVIIRVNEIKLKRDFSQFEQFNLLFDPNENTNKEKFLQLIEKIAETALSYQYENYPKNVEKCFYCNQSLSNESKDLISQIHQLIGNELEKELKEEEAKLKKTLEYIDKNFSLPTLSKELSEFIAEKGLSVNQIFDNSIIVDYQKSINNLTIYSIDNTLLCTQIEILKTILNEKYDFNITKIEETRKSINDIGNKKQQAETALNQLNDNKHLFDNQQIINQLIKLINDIAKYQNKTLSSIKRKISNQQTKANEELVNEQYTTYFNTHLDSFNLRNKDKLTRPISSGGGKNYVDAKVLGTNDKEYSAKEILSEGEAKVHAICDWLAELEFTETTTLVFDDPITSLDHRFIDTFVTRICELVTKYQVIVFTHNQEFYDTLIQKTLGTASIESAKCNICDKLNEGEQCSKKQNNTIYKCGSYYTLDYTTQAGLVSNNIPFFRLSYEQRLDTIREHLIKGTLLGVEAELRQTINSFFENYVLADIKREVFKGADLIHRWKKIHPIGDDDYQVLMKLHNKLSAVGVHEPAVENKTELDVADYINIFNEFVSVINNCRGSNPISLIK